MRTFLMVMLSTKLRVPVVACSVAAAAVVGGVAIADDSPIKAKAPYAQASAKVNADGTRDQSKGIKAITKPGEGTYCVTFDDPRIEVGRSTPVATLVGTQGGTPWGAVMVEPNPTAACGNGTDVLTVYTG